MTHQLLNNDMTTIHQQNSTTARKGNNNSDKNETIMPQQIHETNKTMSISTNMTTTSGGTFLISLLRIT